MGKSLITLIFFVAEIVTIVIDIFVIRNSQHHPELLFVRVKNTFVSSLVSSALVAEIT